MGLKMHDLEYDEFEEEKFKESEWDEWYKDDYRERVRDIEELRFKKEDDIFWCL